MELLGVVSGTMRNVADGGKELPLAYNALPGAAVGVVGALRWKGHPVLGFLTGDALGANAYRMYRGQGDDRTIASCNIAQTASIVGGSLMWKKPTFWGGVLGFVVGAIATSYVPGSNANRLKNSR